MSAIFLLIGASLLVAVGFLALFVWAVRSGQYEDTVTPSMRMVVDDDGAVPGGQHGASVQRKDSSNNLE